MVSCVGSIVKVLYRSGARRPARTEAHWHDGRPAGAKATHWQPRWAGRRAEAGRDEQRPPARGAMRSGIEEQPNDGST